MTTSNNSSFILFRLPSGETAWIPSDVNLRFPDKTSIDPSLLHYLIYIPWDDKYIEKVDPAYRGFFEAVLPYLHVRTTDIHIATCLPFVNELIRADHESVDEQVVYPAFILHDSGWSQMSELEIAESLGVKGLALSGEAVTPKARHVKLGKEIAQRILGEYPFQPPLTDKQKELIYLAILYHDKPQELATLGGIPASVRVVCDVDHLWSFTHENFWQDTVRKGVDPRVYLENLSKDLDGYFVAEPGRQKARQMLEVRGSEVKSWEDWVRGNPQE
jgi:hypothetical protein